MCICIYLYLIIYIYIPGTCLSSILSLRFEPSKTRPKLHSKHKSFGFQVYLYSILIGSSPNTGSQWIVKFNKGPSKIVMIIFRLLRWLRQATIYVDIFCCYIIYIYILYRYFYVDLQPTVYEGICFIWGFGGCLGYAPGVCWGCLRLSLWVTNIPGNQKPVVARHCSWHGHATHNTVAGSLAGVQRFSCVWDPYLIAAMK